MNRRKHKLSRRITAVLLTFAMLFSMVPAAFAAEGESEKELTVKFNGQEIEKNGMTFQLGTTKAISISDRYNRMFNELDFTFKDEGQDTATNNSKIIDISAVQPGATTAQNTNSIYVKSLAVGETEVTVSYTDSTRQQWSTTFTVEVVETGEIDGIQVRAWNGSATQESGNVFQINGTETFSFDPVDKEGKSWSSHLYFSDVKCALSNGDDLPLYIKNVFSSTAIQFRKPPAGISDTIVATIPNLKLKAEDTTDASTTFTVKTKAPEYTAALRLYGETNSPSVGIEEIKAKLDELKIQYTLGSNYVEISGGNLSSKAELENLHSKYNSGLNSNWDMKEFLKFINRHFFNITEPEKYIIKPQHLSGYEKSWFNMNGNAGYFILTLDMAPGSGVEPINENEKVTVTLVNRNGDGESETETFNKGEWINPIYDFQSDDPDYPVTGWTIDGESRYIQGPIVLEDNITLKAVNNVPDHYVRIVVLEDEEDTDLIHSESIDEIEDNGSIYTPKTIGEPQKTENGSNRDFTYKVSLTEYQKLYDGSYSDNETERAALYDFLNTKGLLQVDEINFYDTSVTQYKNAVAGQDIALADEGNIEKDSALTIATFVVSFKPEEVTITPADITIYMGGNDGYEAVVGGEGNTALTTNNSLPEPLFYIEGPEGATLNVTDLAFSDGGSKGWKAKEAGKDATGKTLYRLEATTEGQLPVRVQYINADGEAVISDVFEPSAELFATYVIKMYYGENDPDSIKASADGKTYDVKAEAAGTLTVRAVDDTNNSAADNPVHLISETLPSERLSAGTAAVTPKEENTTYTLNNTTVPVKNPAAVGLLFDTIIDDDDHDRSGALKDKVDSEMGSASYGTTRHYQSRYLDLVDEDNGNAWVKASGPVTVTWAYPEDTGKNTDFTLYHFEGLHRDDSTGGQSGFELDDLKAIDPEEVTITKTDAGIQFEVGSGGFSPFVLVWEEADDDDNPPYIPPTTGDDDDDEEEPDTPALDKVNHFLYVEGYPEDYRTGEYSDNEDLWPVKPQGNITRAEVATIFYRLLKDEVREEIETDVNSFPDVNADDWFNVTVSSLANMGAISGYEDGTFRPNEPITRAELASMAVRFYEAFEAEYEEGTFLDVDGDEWYADAIAAAEELGIIGGYPDGTVRPEANITRAETCAIVNRVLERRPHDDHLGDADDMRTWPDNQPGAWYYADMQEATNGHYYEWIDIDGSKFEEWTEVDKDYDWTKR